MALPPEQISIKRRREEEPPETLYIQSEIHQSKRRFTDFVFQRVQITSDGRQTSSPSPSPLSTAQRAIRSPRSVSSFNVPRTRPAATTSGGAGAGVPLVRATSPGAEFREEKRLAAARKEADEKFKRALHSSPATPSPPSTAATATATATATERSATASPKPTDIPAESKSGPTDDDTASAGGRDTPLRRFQISRASTPMSLLRGSTGAGVHKRKEGGVAVLVEKLRRTPHSRQASLVADAALRADDRVRVEPATTAETAPTRARKRPVVNKAERQWREQRKTAISAAKAHISETLEKEAQTQRQSNWDEESERLAREFEQIALELEHEGMHEERPEGEGGVVSVAAGGAQVVLPKPPLKYQPRTPNKHRAGLAEQSGPSVEQDDESDDGEYVYDTYVRRPLGDGPWLTNPLVDLENGHEAWLRQHGVDTARQDIGVIVITQEDEEYWEHFVVDDEDDEDRWDSEDGDSNAENNPANDYPDEELSWDDEDDEAMAAYSKYRRHAASDDEEFDLDDSASERYYGYGTRTHVESDNESW
ncbi:hypothetical protein BJX96DRAFT_173394 [Aspergillus floccosus]